jgi:hypothetical protein
VQVFLHFSWKIISAEFFCPRNKQLEVVRDNHDNQQKPLGQFSRSFFGTEKSPERVPAGGKREFIPLIDWCQQAE